jgi:hypothetical protein
MYIFIKNSFCIFSCLYLKKQNKNKKYCFHFYLFYLVPPASPLRTPCHSVPVKLKGLLLMMKEKQNKYVRKKYVQMQ